MLRRILATQPTSNPSRAGFLSPKSLSDQHLSTWSCPRGNSSNSPHLWASIWLRLHPPNSEFTCIYLNSYVTVRHEKWSFFAGKRLTSAEKMGLQAPIWGAHHFFFCFSLRHLRESHLDLLLSKGKRPTPRSSQFKNRWNISENYGKMEVVYHLYICKWRLF